jgi:hypothetical protein
MKPTVGRIVHYTLPDGRSSGQVRPAIVVRTWDESYTSIQLQVFTDETNDGFVGGIVWKTSVMQSANGEPELGRWHWPKRED